MDGGLKKSYKLFKSLKQFYSGGPYAVSSDASFLACACNEEINVVDCSTAAVRATVEGDSANVTALVLSPDDKFLFSTSHSRQIKVWDLSSLKCVRTWKGHEGPVMTMACHASGGLLATAGSDSKVKVWDVDGGFCTHSFTRHRGLVNCVMFHPDPSRLLLFSASDDTTVRVWDLTNKSCLATLEKHISAVTSMAITEDGLTLLTAGRDKVVNLWSLHDYTHQIGIPTNEALEAVCVIDPTSPFATYLASYARQFKKSSSSSSVQFVTVGEHGVVRIWNSHGAVCLFQQKSSDITVLTGREEAKRGFTSAMMLPSGNGLLCVTADQDFLFYFPSGSPGSSLELILSKRLVGYNEEIVDMKFLGDEEKFLAVATSVEQVRVYDLASMSCSYVLAGHTDIVLCLDSCVTSSGRVFVVTGSKDNNVRLWDSTTGSCIGIGKGHIGAVGAVGFANKKRNFFVSASSDRTLKVWSLDGLSDDASEPFNLKSKASKAAHEKDINALAVSPDDSLVCCGSADKTACILRLPDLKSFLVLKGHKRPIWSVEFSPVDQVVITASGDKTIKIWDIKDGSCLKTFEGHTSSVFKVSFLSRGAQFVSCGADGLMKLWTVKTNECIATYDQHEDKVWALAVGKRTELLATGGSDSVINLWHDSTASDMEEAFKKEEESVVRGQELENALLDADYTKAIQLAFQLHRPHKLYELFSKLCSNKDAESQIEKAITALGQEEFHLLFEYVREWNTKPKLCHVAHFVLFQVFSILAPTKIIEIRGIGELLEGLLPYSQRHFSRIDRLERSTFLLDYTLSGMSVIEPETSLTELKGQLMENHRPTAEENQLVEAGAVSGSIEFKEPSENHRCTGEPVLAESGAEEEEHNNKEANGKSSSKKRKAHKSLEPVLAESGAEEEEHDNTEAKGKSSSKKQKSHKSLDKKNKKVKGLSSLGTSVVATNA